MPRSPLPRSLRGFAAVGAWCLLLPASLSGQLRLLGGEAPSPPLSQAHWSYDLLETLDALGVSWGWMTAARPSDAQVLRQELLRVVEDHRGSTGVQALVDQWIRRLDQETASSVEAGWRDGEGWLDRGSGGYAAWEGRVWGPGSVSAWGRWDSGSRQAFSGWMEGGLAVPVGSWTLVGGRLPLKSGVPSLHSVQFSGATPSDGVFLFSRKPAEFPGLGWLLGPGVWQLGLSPWAGFDRMEVGWVGLASATFQPHPRVRLGAARTARFGGENNAGVTAQRLLRTALFQKNDPFWWDDHKLELSARLRWSMAGQPLTTHLVLAQEDSPLWMDPALAVGIGAPLHVRGGIVQVGYEYAAYGARARWCPGCGYARGPQDNRYQGEWYTHGQHGDHMRRGIPVGNPLGGYGAVHSVAVRMWGGDGLTRSSLLLASARRDRGNMLQERWPGRRYSGEAALYREVWDGMELGVEGLLAGGDGRPREGGLWISGRMSVAGGSPEPRAAPGGRGAGDGAASADAPLPVVAPGTRVRVHGPGLLHHRLEAEVVAGSPTSLSLRTDAGEVLTLGPARVGRVEVQGPPGRATWRGAFLGMMAGLALGEGITAAARANDRIDPRCGELDCFSAAFVPSLVAAGGAAGALVGSRIRTRVWLPVGPGAGVEVSISTGRGGFR